MIHGVAYSADPVTGRRDRVRLTAQSGVAIVDTGIATWHVAERQGLTDVSDAHCLTLARLAVRLEWAVGEGQDPQALDWWFDGHQFTLGAPRAIQDFPRLTIALARGQRPLWSNGNLKDAIAGVPTTASWSFIAPYLRSILFAPITQLGYPVPPGMEVVRRFEGRAYLDLASLQAIYFDALGVLPMEANRSLGGPLAEIAVPPAMPKELKRWDNARRKALWLLLRHPRRYARAIDQVQRMARVYGLHFSSYSDTQLMDLAEEIAQQQVAFGPLFQMGNFEAGTWLTPLEQLLDRSRPGDGSQLAAALMAGSGQVTSAEHGYRLVQLARTTDDAVFKRELARFLDDFGHRGVYEAELANPRWIEDSSFLMAQVRELRHQGVPADRANEQRVAAEHVLQELPLVARLAARWLARRARRSAALREAGKSALIAMALPVRRILLEFGDRMVQRGVLEHVDDVFHLSRADLETYVRGEWDGSDFRVLVAQRRELRARRLALPPPPDLIGSLEAPRTAIDGVLRGMAAAPGRACGPARLISHPSDSARLQRGDILVAPSTDPGWTPLFLRCAAVVTEVGGFLSHGAIVAREYGLPAVVNVQGVLQALSDGEVICVDGNRGLVERQLEIP